MTFLDVSQGAVLIKYTPHPPSPVSLLCNTYSDPLAATSYPKTLTPHPPICLFFLGARIHPDASVEAGCHCALFNHSCKKKKEVKKE